MSTTTSAAGMPPPLGIWPEMGYWRGRYNCRVLRQAGKRSRARDRRDGSPAIDYTLAKRAVLRNFRRGMLDRVDICDAHPDLIRAARNIGRLVERDCPVCSTEGLRQVSYVFGDQLKHLSGRVVYPDGWVQELIGSYDEFRCYVVEVCVACSWNHLSACFLLGRRFAV